MSLKFSVWPLGDRQIQKLNEWATIGRVSLAYSNIFLGNTYFSPN
uniref:Uncharacterized protein n=1 Tax=Anguilla anguilla TaxID=7936 RepID=A0A0E9QUG8_ANGAN